MKKVSPLPLAVILTFAAITLLSCSSSSPVTPDTLGSPEPSVVSQSLQSPNRAFIGFWTIHISTDRETIEAIPARFAELHLNVVNLIEGKACSDCLVIEDQMVTPSDKLYVKLRLKHPYPGLIQYTGFDVRGILMTGSDYLFTDSGRTMSWNGSHVKMLAPDGYTNLYNPTEFPETLPGPPALRYIPGHHAPGGDLSATLNPYVSYNKDQERCVFLQGTSSTKTIYLQLVPGPLELGYAVDACWKQVETPITDPITDFPPEANCREAYVVFPGVGAGLKPIAGSSAKVSVEAWDHQGIDTIAAVTIEAPDLFPGIQELTTSTVTAEGAIYSGTLVNVNGAPLGEYPMLVRVVDIEQDENLGQIDAWQVDTVRVTESGTPIIDLICIPAGWFYMGADDANDPEGDPMHWDKPGHIHPTDAFCIGKYEITHKELEGFVLDGGYSNPAWWSPEGLAWKELWNVTQPDSWIPYVLGHYPPEWPWTCAFYEAEAFCNWAGGRLPTEAEWERAARGDIDHRVYPWGDEWDPTKVSCFDNPNITEFGNIVPVGTCSPQGDSPWGLADCVGNVDELTSTWGTMLETIYSQYATGDFTPPPPYPPGYLYPVKIMRGGNINNVGEFQYMLRCAHRDGASLGGFSNDGFRIAFDD